MGIKTVKNCHTVVNFNNAWRLIMCKNVKKKGLASQNWTDSSISLDERQIKECQGGWQRFLPLPNLSRKIEGDYAHRVTFSLLF